MEFTEQHLRTAIEGMQTRGAPGPDGLRPSQLKQITRLKFADAKNIILLAMSKI